MHVLSAVEAQNLTIRAARGLHGLDLRAGDRLVIGTPEQDAPAQAAAGQVATLAIVSAALRLGVIPVMVHPLATGEERAQIVADSGAKLLLVGTNQLTAVVTGGAGPVPELAPHPLGRPMHYTSGTTGLAKGVYADLDEAEALAYWTAEREHWAFTAGDVMLVHSPLAHSAPLRLALCALAAGGSVLAAGRFDATAFAQVLASRQPTVAFTVPTQLQMLLDLPGGPPPSPYRRLIHAGAPCLEPLKRRVHAWAGADRVVEFYSATEGHFTTCTGPEWEERPGTVGRARNDRSIRVDEEGHVWCEAPAYARFAYWGDPGKTAAAWQNTPTGREFTVCDVGGLDADAYLTLDGRREDLIITGGVNVYPAEVEAAILRYCPVADVVVHPVAHHKWGQAVCATVVTDVAPSALRAALVGHLSAVKIPKYWQPVSEIPRNTMGKVDRERLPVPVTSGA